MKDKICENCGGSFKPNPKIKNELWCEKCMKISNKIFNMKNG